MPNKNPSPKTRFKDKGEGIGHTNKPICAAFPPEIDIILRALPNRSEKIRQWVIQGMQRESDQNKVGTVDYGSKKVVVTIAETITRDARISIPDDVNPKEFIKNLYNEGILEVVLEVSDYTGEIVSIEEE